MASALSSWASPWSSWASPGRPKTRGGRPIEGAPAGISARGGKMSAGLRAAGKRVGQRRENESGARWRACPGCSAGVQRGRETEKRRGREERSGGGET
uniref:Uncharacterized protein n=1 Tax=Arundo donax TaxID=35708 RepID=A0A0A9CMR9_ARUDO